jgi:hypothetical protein
MSEFRQRFPLLVSFLIALALFAACSQGHRSPTEPEPLSASPSTVTAASNGHGGGNGGGNGNGHGHGSDLTLALQPDVWNTNWAHSQGTVSALITGSNLNKIDLSSIMLIGNGGGQPVSATRTSRAGNHVRAFFLQSDAIGSLDHPKRGDTVEVKVQLTQDGQSVTLSAQVRIVGPAGGGGNGGGDDGDLEAEIQPNHWNSNFVHSSGTVTALITGPDLSKIDLKSIVLIGTDPAAAPLHATRADLHGNHVRAFFPQSGAWKTLLNPKQGKTYKITIELTVDGTKTDLTARVTITGPES